VSLDRKCRISVKEACDGDRLQAGTAYLAPGGKHLLAENDNGEHILLRTGNGPPENGCRPAVDVLLRSAAKAVNQRMVAVILTGMGNDGTRGLAALKEKDVFVIAQDEASSVVWGMPGNAVREGYVDEVVPLDRIIPSILAVVKKEPG
ncbi:CheB methylesterase domain-containing protein, partial [Fibrobacterota bacterium]